jgi:hypothetical protein
MREEHTKTRRNDSRRRNDEKTHTEKSIKMAVAKEKESGKIRVAFVDQRGARERRDVKSKEACTHTDRARFNAPQWFNSTSIGVWGECLVGFRFVWCIE